MEEQNALIEVEETVVAIHGLALSQLSLSQIQQLFPVFLQIVLLDIADSLVKIRLNAVVEVVLAFFELLTSLGILLTSRHYYSFTEFQIVHGSTRWVTLFFILS